MLGPRIAALRREAGLSQAELAQQLGVSPSAVGMYEQGRREPSMDMLVQLARIFQVSTDFLLTGSATSVPETDRLNRAMSDILCMVDARLDQRGKRPFSKQELAVLMAAILMEP